jgi:hypothetical protein
MRPLQPIDRLVLIFACYNFERVTGELQNVHSSVCAVYDVDVPAVSGDIIGLDYPAANHVIALVGATPKIRIVGDCGDEISHILRVVRIANVKGAHARVEVRHEDYFL